MSDADSTLLRLYKFYDARWGIENLSQRRLKISTLDDLNDPFEFNHLSIVSEDHGKLWEFIRKATYSQYGVICFSRTWDNPVIWSHYSDKHRGICLGFDVPSKYFVKVKYFSKRKKIPDFHSLSDLEREQAIKDSMASKYSHWKYENEYRVFCKLQEVDLDSGLYFKRFDEFLQIKEVIIGPNSKVTAEQVRDATPFDRDLKIVSARLADRSFRVVKGNPALRERA